MKSYLLQLVAAAVLSFDFLEAQEIIKNQNQVITMEQYSTPEYLYKIVSKDEWQESLLRNEVISSAIDKDFIHLAQESQVTHVVQKYWKNKDYVILKIASAKLIGRMIYETNPKGTNKYYHLYEGNIPLEAVKDVTIVTQD